MAPPFSVKNVPRKTTELLMLIAKANRTSNRTQSEWASDPTGILSV
jgi:hypothetical protein